LPIPNDSIPLFCVSEGVFRETNRSGNEYQLTHALIAAGALPDIEGGLPLACAVSFGTVRVVDALLDSGAAVDGVDRDGVPMSYAVHFGWRDVAELLYRRGGSLDLRFAAGLGRLNLVKSWFNPDGSLKPGAGALSDPYGLELKMRGGSMHRCDRTRANILDQSFYFACANVHLEVAEYLLQQGAKINAIVPGLDSHATVLHLIATRDPSYLPVIQFLLDHGANRAVRDEEYFATPADWARHARRQEALELLNAA